MATSYLMQGDTRLQLHSEDIHMLYHHDYICFTSIMLKSSVIHTYPWHSFEKSVQNPGTHVKSLNNLATMYYRLGE